MTKEKNSMDNFLRESIGNMEIEPSRNVWKGVSKKLIIFELLRLNFTNVSKAWLYSGFAVVATFAGLSYFGLQKEAINPDLSSPLSKTEQTSTSLSERFQNTESQSSALSGKSTQTTSTFPSEMISESENSVSNPTASEIVSDYSTNNESAQNIKTNNLETHHISNSSKEKTALNTTPRKKQATNSQTLLIDPESIISSQENENAAPTYILTSIFSELNILQTKPKWDQIDSSQLIANHVDQTEEKKNRGPRNYEWFMTANYMPEWPIAEEDIYVNNYQLSLSTGLQYNKMSISVGIGMMSEKTPSKYQSHYLSYDSVGYFYDIESFEEHPFIEDSIIIHYTIRNIFDSVAHQSKLNGPDQRRRWIFVPIELGYQLISNPKYELRGKLSATFGWEAYTESPNNSQAFPSNYSIEDITPASQSFVKLGIGLENSFSILPQWWIYAEPRVNYYTKSPYQIKESNQSGPFGFGLQLGVKYKFKGKR